MSENFVYILVSVNLVILGWLIFLTMKIQNIYRKAKQLFSGGKQGNLSEVLEKYVSDVNSVEDHCTKIDGETKKLSKMAGSSLQKVGHVRYNPFGNIGGDQSFSLCLLDNKENGFVISSIHSREGTRVYLKPVTDGKSDYNLSEEEKRAIELAQKK